MSDALARPRWRILFTPRWLGWHLFAVVAVIGMIWLGDWQFRRAESGNLLSWAYTFEWPVFAIFGVVFWIKTVRDELHPAADGDGLPKEVQLPAGVRSWTGAGSAGAVMAGPGAAAADQSDDDRRADTELAEYNAYLARLSKEARGHGRWHGFR